VLDIGAGAGVHSLALQERGMEVVAIDIAPEAVQVMSSRGVTDARCSDIYGFQDGAFDTLLMMMHGIGMVGDLAGLDRFLAHAKTLLRPGGQIVCDSLDVRPTTDPRHRAYLDSLVAAGRYVGEIRIRFEYKGLVGPLGGWMHVDPDKLAQHATRAGWACQVVCSQKNGDYLARLALSGAEPELA
jgi:SAM-dependent methyltransferase